MPMQPASSPVPALPLLLALASIPSAPALARDSKWITNPSDYSVYFDKSLPGDPQPDTHWPYNPHIYMQGRKLYLNTTLDVSDYSYMGIGVWGSLDKLPALQADGKALNPLTWSRISYDGAYRVTSPDANGIRLTRAFYPSLDRWAGFQELNFKNVSAAPVRITVAGIDTVWTPKPGAKYYPVKDWTCETHCPASAFTLAPGADSSVAVAFYAHPQAEAGPAPDARAEKAAWDAFKRRITRDHLRLETPDSVVNVLFALTKLRSAMMPCSTYQGVMATTGDGYAPGIWANDNIDYCESLFPFIGDSLLSQAGLNNLRYWLQDAHSMSQLNIMGSYETADMVAKMFNRGDDAMMLGAAPLMLLGHGDRAIAQSLWPLINTTQLSIMKNTSDGIVHSCTDEGEDRWSCGPVEPASRWDAICQKTNAQVSTNAMAYAGYVNAANLAKALGMPDTAAAYAQKAAALSDRIETFFGADLLGYHTYRFHAGLDKLRGWMGHPLNTGIYTRKQGTLDALFSPAMWDSAQGVYLESGGKPSNWIRQTLYLIRGAFAAGDADRAYAKLMPWARNTLLGQPGPSAPEDAYIAPPSLLFTRIFTEGAFGLKAVSFKDMECAPHMPSAWPAMALRHVRLFQKDFDVEVKRAGADINVKLLSGGKTLFDSTGAPGRTWVFDLSGAAQATTGLEQAHRFRNGTPTAATNRKASRTVDALGRVGSRAAGSGAIPSGDPFAPSRGRLRAFAVPAASDSGRGRTP